MTTSVAGSGAVASDVATPTHDRILDATLHVLARDGIAGVKIRTIAREAGVAVGLANYHFDNKTALVGAALRRIGEHDLELITPTDGDEYVQSHRDRLERCLRRTLDPEFLDPAYLSLRLQLWSLAGVDPAFAAINRNAQRRYLDGLTKLLQAARPDLGPADVEARAADILVIQNGVWLTAILIEDDEAVQRALERCRTIAFR